MSGNAEEYLEKKVRGIIEPMVSALLMDRPKEPVRLVINLDAVYDRLAAELRRVEVQWPEHGANRVR